MFVVLVQVQVEAVTAMIGLVSTLRTPSQATTITTIIATAIIIENKLMLLEEEEL
jgi:hypothetical protein